MYNKKKQSNSNKKHGMRYHPLYTVWDGIKQRCLNELNPNYHRYGGRGIKMCDEWRNDPSEFINWALANGWEEGLEIDRRDNNDDYTPSNCQFVTHKKNSSNTRKNRHCFLDGVKLIDTEASRQLGHSDSYVAKIRSGKIPNKYQDRLQILD